MANVSRKPAASRNFKATLHTIESAQKKEHASFSKGRNQLEKAMNAAREAQWLALESACICCDNMDVWHDSASSATHATAKMHEIWWGRASGGLSCLLSEAENASSCQSVTDLYELHNLALKQAIEGCLVAAGDMYDIIFDCAAKTMDTINERSAHAMKQWQKTLA